ncbi:PHP domain-containing protein [Halorubrum sp. JWXQ-INN 858]|uniref:PHP domain-containing protein n=1 Tax=Halorubrum sp. JWXQ-INN 858 TaxID=2690782 RepID=UPI001356BFD8|nr:PHP domain-containing protein [Halorubrum sp. JWXQ-INN 858]MWV63495.1 PHP domain-containing protein [Halorubrum sp. JWXQ-INN 858]
MHGPGETTDTEPAAAVAGGGIVTDGGTAIDDETAIDDGTATDDAAIVDGEVIADLHTHTTASDGTLRIEEVPAAAREAGLDWVAVTDHDRIHPGIDAPVVERDGVRIVRGIELRVDAGVERLDLLGYAVRGTDPLVAEVDRLQADRQERGARMLERVEQRLGVTLDLEPRPGIGRPHIARAIDASSAPYDYDAAFEELIGDGGPCFVAREVTALDRGIELLRDACAFVGLAHPFRYRDVDAALDVARRLDAVERWYPYGRDVDVDLVDRVAASAGLLRTGGSDAHGRALGGAGLTTDTFEPIRERLPEPDDEQG